jgi:hypothetical protein
MPEGGLKPRTTDDIRRNNEARCNAMTVSRSSLDAEPRCLNGGAGVFMARGAARCDHDLVAGASGGSANVRLQ